MKLYLIQHGEAKSEAEDSERSLAVRGEEEVRRVVLKVHGWYCSFTEPLSASTRKKIGVGQSAGFLRRRWFDKVQV